MIDWITSVKPAGDADQLLIENCLLAGFDHDDCRLVVVNGAAERDVLPGVSERAALHLVARARPSLRDILDVAEGDITILSNADVRVFAQRPLSQVIDPRAALSVSRRYDVEHADLPRTFAEADRVARRFGYLQSRFTIDLFVISRAFRDHLLTQDWTRDTGLGQAGVDMLLLREAYGFGRVRRLDRDIRLLHRNHEPFKVALPINIVVDREENQAFSTKRGAAFRGEAMSMILADLPGVARRVPMLRRTIVRLDMLTVKLRNRLQFWWSKVNFRRARRIRAAGAGVHLALVGRIWFFARTGRDAPSVDLDAAALRDDLRRRYKELLQS